MKVIKPLVAGLIALILLAGFVFLIVMAVKEDSAHVKHCQAIGGWVSRKTIVTPVTTIVNGRPSITIATVTESYCWTEQGLRDNWN